LSVGNLWRNAVADRTCGISVGRADALLSLLAMVRNRAVASATLGTWGDTASAPTAWPPASSPRRPSPGCCTRFTADRTVVTAPRTPVIPSASGPARAPRGQGLLVRLQSPGFSEPGVLAFDPVCPGEAHTWPGAVTLNWPARRPARAGKAGRHSSAILWRRCEAVALMQPTGTAPDCRCIRPRRTRIRRGLPARAALGPFAGTR
jgi:hypothetical protein